MASSGRQVAVPRVSVVTPTYNRRASLPRLHESLNAQTLRDFEWVVVDDGSTDGTRELVENWGRKSQFPIRYFWQPNAGRLSAVNRGVEHALGEYCAVIDSDDWYPREALERMIAHWDGIPPEERERFANVEGLCASETGKPLSSKRGLPQPVLDADNFTIVTRYGIPYDKKGMYRTAVLREFPFPVRPGTVIPEDTVFFRIAERYRSRFVNEVWGFKEYLPAGVSETMRADPGAFAFGFRLYNQTVITLRLDKPLSVLLKAYANFVRYSLHEQVPLRTQRTEVPSRSLWLLGLPIGTALYVRDGLRSRRRVGRTRRRSRSALT